jgi:CcmD family protein
MKSLFAAYLAIWTLLFLYLWNMDRRTRALERIVKRLAGRLED